MSWQLSTASTEVLDDGRRRRYCRIIFAGCCSQPPPHRPMWSMFESTVSDHGSFPLLKPLPGCLLVRRHVREPTTESDCASVSGQAQIRPGTTRPIITLPRRYACQKSMRREMRSARPTVNNRGIDARNGQAYHGRKTIATNGTRPAALGSRPGEGQRAEERRRRRLASCVRSCAGAAGRTRVLRAGTEAAIARSSMR